MKYLPIAKLQELDRQAIQEDGLSLELLMENAGRGIAKFIIDNYPLKEFPGITLVCGKGNNGGDGFVAARLLAQQKYQVKIILLQAETELKSAALNNFKKLPADIKLTNYIHYQNNNKLAIGEIIQNSDLLIDAIFGTGLAGQVTEHYADIITACNFSGKPIIAVDIPSGINGDSGPTSDIFIRPAATVTFVAAKLAMQPNEYQDLFGRIEVIDIGIPLA